jgi:hypothetical protein
MWDESRYGPYDDQGAINYPGTREYELYQETRVQPDWDTGEMPEEQIDYSH